MSKRPPRRIQRDRPPAGELFGSVAMVCVDIVRLALQTRSVTISPSSRLVNITAPTDLHRPSDPQVSTERPSSFSFACKAVGPCTGMSADLQTRDGVHTRRPTPWHQLLRAASVARAARPAAWSFRRVDAKVGPEISPVMCAGTAYQTPSSVVSVGASESPRCAPLPHRCRAAAAEAKNGPSVRAFERGYTLDSPLRTQRFDLCQGS